jgi:hypothetical protein
MITGYLNAGQREQLRQRLLRASGRHRHFNFVSAGDTEDLTHGALRRYVEKLRERCRTMRGDPREPYFRAAMRQLCVDSIAIDVVHVAFPEWHQLLVQSVSPVAIVLILRLQGADKLSERDLRTRFGVELFKSDVVRCLTADHLVHLPPAEFLDLLLTAIGPRH